MLDQVQKSNNLILNDTGFEPLEFRKGGTHKKKERQNTEPESSPKYHQHLKK